MPSTRLASLLALTALLLIAAVPALAVDEGTPEGTPAPVEFEGNAPAVTVEEPPQAEVAQPWTSKFLIPSGLLLGGVVVFYTVIQYFTRVVRTRYKPLQ